jgi:hypothetical protein
LKKKQGKKKLGMTWLARWVNPTTRLTRSKTQLQFVDFCFVFFFLLKRHHFDFLKKLTRMIQATRSKPGTRALDRAGSKNYG